MSTADQIRVAELTGEARHHAKWRELTADERAAAVAALRELAGGQADLLAEVAGHDGRLRRGPAAGPPGRDAVPRCRGRRGADSRLDRGGAASGTNSQGATTLNVASGSAFSTVGAFIVVDSASVDGGAEIVVVSSAGSSTSIPIANTPLRLTHTAGATVQTAALGPLGPMT